MTLLYLVAAWIGGILAAGSSLEASTPWLALAATSLIVMLLARRDRRWRLLFACGLFLALGAVRTTLALRDPGPDHIAYYTGSGYITLEGTLTRPPDPRDAFTNLRLDADHLISGNESLAITGAVLVQAPRYGEYHYGDRVQASGTLLTPPEFDGFSYRDYLARQGIRAMMPNARVSVVAQDQGKPWLAAIYGLRDRARTVIDRLLPSPQAPLLDGILLGDESSISSTIDDAFRRTGTSHIVAISGANIVIVIRVLMGLLQPGLGRKRAAWLTLLGVIAYTVLVGAAASVVRAAIMGGLSIFAAQTGRRVHGLTTLAFAAWLMTLWNPVVLWDVGFQLSVAATAGLVLFSRDFTQWLEAALRRGFAATTARRVARWLSEPVAVSLAAQIATLPLIVLYFGQISLVTLLANALVVPLQPYVMILGGLAAVAGLVVVPIGQLFAWAAWIPLTITLGVVRELARPDWASLAFEIPPDAAWLVLGVLFAFGIFRLQHPDDRAALLARFRRRAVAYAVIIGGVVLAVLVWAMALSQPDDKLHVWFLDVGHGNAVLVQTPRGAQILIDGGPNPKELRRAVGDALPFWDHDLDLLVVTQPAPAAISALPALLDTYIVQAVLTNGRSAGSDSYRALMERWTQQDAAVLAVSAGYQAATADGVTLEVLHPFAPDQPGDGDAVALVLRVTYGDASFLVMPDLAPEAEENLLNSGVYLGGTVLTLVSHGDTDLNPAALFNAVSPQAAVVMVGAGQRNGLPASDVLERAESLTGHPVYRTDQDGTVEFVTDGQTLTIRTAD